MSAAEERLELAGEPARWALDLLKTAERIYLFLDYDGTLADFAPTPDDITPDPEVIELVSRLAQRPGLRVAVISGRRLGHVRKLLPVPGVLLAGTYGVELVTPEGDKVEVIDYVTVRPAIERLKTLWEQALASRPGLYLEDKGWALALHARYASEQDAREALEAVRWVGRDSLLESGLFRILEGERFFEVCPAAADKGRAVEWILESDPWPGALPVYLGDDDKDEAAFSVIQRMGGVAGIVGGRYPASQADFRLANPQAARRWLEDQFLTPL